ncbi:MAG: polysaccharide biosynthesis C-terminal domain-containing protein, partial [Oscillospiraceae bacterium]|nr:polysaccharide biosynthesis C-terminal domain-containing protein [Oscillospiraceae bacterium]
AANAYASTAFFLALITAMILSVLGILFLPQFVVLLGSTKTIQPFAEDYCLWIMLGAPFIVCSHVMNNLLRYEGKATLAMFALLAGAALNIALDPLLILVFKMGVAGAGLATAFSQMVGFCILLSIFLRGKTQSRLSPRFVIRDVRKIFDMAFTGFPSLIRQGLNSGCTITLNNLIRAGGYGDPAISAMSIVSRIAFFIFASGLGIGQGFQPISSFNYGAGKYTRVRKAFFWTLGIATGSIAVICSVCLLFSGDLIALFRDDPKVIEIGTRALILQCAAMYFQSFGTVTEMMFQSTGKKLGASILSTFRSGGLFLLFLLILAPLRGLAGIQEAQPLANFCSTLIAIPFAVTFLKKLPKEDLKE